MISGLATKDQAETAMEKVHERLASKYGLALCDPPFTKTDHKIVRAAFFNPGLKENAGIFVHTQAWAVMAETILGHGNRAYEYLRAYLPAAYNEKAEIREIEPYLVCRLLLEKKKPKHGVSRIPWLSGSASWTYHAITPYGLGIRTEANGLLTDPCIPSKWKSFTARRIFRGKVVRIDVDNPKGVEKGVKNIVLNGDQIEGNLIPFSMLRAENEVSVTMG